MPLLHDNQGLAALKARHDFLLMVDEAHATLVCGEHGGGAAEAMGVAHHVSEILSNPFALVYTATT